MCMSRPEQVLTKRILTDVKALQTKRGRDEQRKFIVEGWKAIADAVAAGAECDILLYDPASVKDAKQLNRLSRGFQAVYPARTKELESIADAVTTQGVIGVFAQLDHRAAFTAVLKKSASVIVAVDGINDPGNLGTIIRACDWFGVDAVLTSEQSVDLYNPKTVRATMGSLFHLPVLSGVALPAMLMQCRNEGFTVYSTELEKSTDVRSVPFAAKSVIIIGSESHGVSSPVSALAQERILIPSFGKAESLNAAMACSVILARIRL